MSTDPRTDEDHNNNLVAAGALFAALHSAGQQVEVVISGRSATNQLDVRFAFLKSPYRITVERVREDEDTA